MKRIAPTLGLFALSSLFVFSTTSCFAYPHKLHLNLGSDQAASQAQYPTAGYHEFKALNASVPSAAYGANLNHYMSDISQDGIYTWEKHKMPIKIFVSDGTGIPGYRPQFSEFIKKSFDVWCEASGNKISWVEVSDANRADITVKWTDSVYERPEGTEAGKTSAFTRLNTATGRGIIYGAQMQLLTRLPGRNFGDEEVAKTCLHEAGHAFGLQGHSRVRTDIMYYAVSPNQSFELSARDRATIAKLYASFPTIDGLAVEPKLETN